MFSLSKIYAEKKTFCFLLGCFNGLSPKSCSPTETETYRNRKFDTETEISASESDFRFRLCSTPNQRVKMRCVLCIFLNFNVNHFQFNSFRHLLAVTTACIVAFQWHRRRSVEGTCNLINQTHMGLALYVLWIRV